MDQRIIDAARAEILPTHNLFGQLGPLCPVCSGLATSSGSALRARPRSQHLAVSAEAPASTDHLESLN